jgi:hypothetical protein
LLSPGARVKPANFESPAEPRVGRNQGLDVHQGQAGGRLIVRMKPVDREVDDGIDFGSSTTFDAEMAAPL